MDKEKEFKYNEYDFFNGNSFYVPKQSVEKNKTILIEEDKGKVK